MSRGLNNSSERKKTNTIICEKDGITLYRTNAMQFFMVIKHKRQEPLNEIAPQEIKDRVSDRRIMVADDISEFVSADTAEKWVKKYCPEAYSKIYEPKSNAVDFEYKISITRDEYVILSQICARENKTRLEVLSEELKKWLEKKGKNFKQGEDEDQES